jgi:uncharacterized membrane protein YdjX (TVP38/TMEM64 family)
MKTWLLRYWRTLVLLALVILGVVLLLANPLSPERILVTGKRLAHDPAALALIVAGMALFYALALPGSAFFWLIAPFQPPWIAVPLLVTGSVGGAMGGYGLARYLGRDWVTGERSRRILDVLQHRGDTLTQFAFRVLPGFPHSVLNFGAGAVGLPLFGYVLAAALGLGIKWSIYAGAVHGAVEALEAGERPGAATLAPLAVLAVLVLAGVALRRRFLREAGRSGLSRQDP